jgi:hypothetical protein
VRSPPTQKKRKKKSYREQRHRLSSARFFAGREGHDRSARGGFHRALLLQAFGLGDRRFRGHVKGGLNDRSHFIYVLYYACAVMKFRDFKEDKRRKKREFFWILLMLIFFFLIREMFIL